MQKLAIILSLLLPFSIKAQESSYFPPFQGSEWENLSIEDAGWCEEPLEALREELEDNETKAFIVLKSGKIVIEEYFDNFHQDSSWVWFSAGKTLTAFLVGLAQEQGKLSIEDPVSQYLGESWTELDPEQENKIKIRHQLTMTTGLDYTVSDPFCTDRECLLFRNEPGEHWYYHNAPYSLLRDVLESATSKNLNVYTFTELKQAIGMDGIWLPIGFNNFYFSPARSMARFGLLMLNKGTWDGTDVMHDKSYFDDMITSSQDLNPAYGYLWWLNGKDKFKLPGSDIVFSGPIDAFAPEDMYCAIGASGQILCVLPEDDIVFVRMGSSPNADQVPVAILQSITTKLNPILCRTSNANKDLEINQVTNIIIPNPVGDSGFRISEDFSHPVKLSVYNTCGYLIYRNNNYWNEEINPELSPGMYMIRIDDSSGIPKIAKLIKN